jgi:hypothetical protein
MDDGRIDCWFICGQSSLCSRSLLQVPQRGDTVLLLGHVYVVEGVTWTLPGDGGQAADVRVRKET